MVSPFKTTVSTQILPSMRGKKIRKVSGVIHMIINELGIKVMSKVLRLFIV